MTRPGRQRASTNDRLGNHIAQPDLGGDQNGGQDDVTLTEYDAFYRLFAVRELKEKAPAFETSARYYGVNVTASGTASNLWGALAEQCGVNGVCTRHSYDVLGRLVGKDFNQSSGGNCAASASMEVSYSYDTGHGETQRSRGQLTQVAYSDLSYRQELGYDAFGRLVSQAVSIAGAGQPFISETYYDAYQRPIGLRSPDGEAVKTSYNSMGLPRQLCEASWQSTTGELACLAGQPALVSAAHYDHAGRLTGMGYPAGGGLWRSQEYYPWSSSNGNSNGRLAEVRLGTAAGGSDLLRLHYSYDSFGNVSELQERYGSEAQQSQRFCYDAQNRLVRGFAPASAAFDCASTTAGQRYSYDAAGRLTNYEGTAFTAGALRAHLSLPGGVFAGLAYAVHANGNLTKRGDAQLVWDHENRLVMFSRSGTIESPNPPLTQGGTPELTPEPIEGGGAVSTWSEKESYLYNADGVRVKKVAPNGAATYTPFPHYEVSDGVVTKYYFFAGQRIAMKRDGVLTYLHSDHLGSTVLETNTSGQIVADQRYYAYGRQRDTSPVTTDYRFTGQRQDASGLVYMNARYYDPAIGQFISPDTLVPNAGVLMDYNRYGYARGNPLKYNDPSGHCATLSSGEADENDAECWTLARTIAKMWGDTDYWQTRFGDVIVWNDLIAPSGATAEFFAGELDMFLHNEAGKTWLAVHTTEVVDPAADPFLVKFDEYCNKSGHDCTSILLDGIGAGSAVGVAIVCIPGFAVCGSVAAIGGGISIASGGIGVAWTANQVYHGNATKEDLVVSTATFVIGSVGPVGRVVSSRTIATVGLGASAMQMTWDLWGATQNSERYAPYHE